MVMSHRRFSLVAVLLLAACSAAPGTHEDVGSSGEAQTTICGVPDNGVVQGVDVSHYQGAFDWTSAKAGGTVFGYASIGDGTGYSDPDFTSNWSNMKAAGVLRGAYQYFEPGQDPTAQANLMIQAVGLLGGGDLPCMVDVETTGGQSGATIAANVRTWINAVTAGTGRTPFIYTGPSFWDGSVGDTSFGSIPLWIADYGPPGGCPAAPNGWANWTIWQYGDSGGSLDQDVWNGSLAQLEALAAPPAPACTNACTEAKRVGMTSAPTGEGYWIADAAGGVYPDGNASFLGDLIGTALAKPVVGIAATPSGQGYWLVAADGGVFAFGDAGFQGSEGGKPLNAPIVGMTPTPDGGGYWLVGGDGGVFAFGTAGFYGSAGSTTLNAPMVAMAATPSGKGYWLVGADGGVFAYGDAPFEGSAGGMTLNAPVVGVAATPSGKGYWLVAADGGIFAYGDAPFEGSAGSTKLNQPVVGMGRTVDAAGYWLVAADGGVFAYGDAPYLGNGLATTCASGVPQVCAAGSNGCYGWTAGPACSAGEACSNGTCQSTCTDACTTGSSRCNGASIELCGRYGSSPCNTWSGSVACPTGQTCTGTVCASPACSDACEPGASECQNGDLLACTGITPGGCHTWGTATACQAGETCQTNGCVTKGALSGDAGGVVDGSMPVEHDAGKPTKDGGQTRIIDASAPGQPEPSDTGTAGDADTSSSAGSSGGCSMTGRRSSPSCASAAVFALLMLARRRRTGSRTRPAP
jgi:GH25 family lysozyme M1 (1,4-beta-N-acetylmuramidase)